MKFEIFLIALLIDFTIGELPIIIHPVVYFGKITNFYKKKIKLKNNWHDIFLSVPLILVIVSLFVLPLFFIDSIVIRAIVLSTTFSFKFFRNEVKKLINCFETGSKEEIKKAVSYLVSRNLDKLTKEDLLNPAIETMIENITDSIVSPIFYFIIFGVEGALFYRIINTLDAIIGYKDRYFYFGKIVARIDDLLNFIPARITALLIFVVSVFLKESKGVLPVFFRDRYKTESPNAGQTMSMIAAILKIKLEKKDFYVLGEDREKISVEKFKKAFIYFNIVSIFYFLLSAGILWILEKN